MTDCSAPLPLSLLPVQMESGGTVLSTNWKDVGKRKVEMSPPDDVEFKKYRVTPTPSLLFDPLFLHNCASELKQETSSPCSLHDHPLPILSYADSLVFSLQFSARSLSVPTVIRLNHTHPTHCNSLYQMESVNLNNLLIGLISIIWFLKANGLKRELRSGLKCDWQTWNAQIQPSDSYFLS